jgi:energy-coupling factor transport system substrate-specific component
LIRNYVFIIIFSLILNFTGSFIQYLHPFPLFLDTTGTMLSAILIGPWIGGLVGLLTNTLQGIFHTPLSLPFGIVNLSIGLTTGYIVIYLKGFQRWYSPLVVGIITGLLAPLIAAPIVTYLFGGITTHGVDKFVVALVDSGSSILSSAFWGRLPYSFADKLISAYIVFFLIKKLPTSNLQFGRKQ